MDVSGAPETGWRLVWSDEFDGAAGSRPDVASWSAELGGGGWGCGQLQRYTDSRSNAALDGAGHLAIVARRERAAEDEPAVTSARLVTKGRVTVTYGRIEARIRVPPGQGMWPAFWMLGSDLAQVGWPACGEIDVMEVVGSQPGVVHGTLHAPGYSGLAGGFGYAHDAGVDLTADFHVYGVEWAPDRIVWRLDGRTYNAVSSTDVPGGSWPFTHGFFLVVNLAVGGDWPGNDVQDPELPATMLVDWIRVSEPVSPAAALAPRSTG